LDRPIISTGIKIAVATEHDIPALLLQRVARPLITDEKLSVEYLYLWFRSPAFVNSIDPGRSNGVPHISTKQIEQLQICIPDIDQQHRIVAKVDELMALCDQLEAGLRRQEETAAALAAAMCQAVIEGGSSKAVADLALAGAQTR
jgi:type I restriction enzyme S subunit